MHGSSQPLRWSVLVSLCLPTPFSLLYIVSLMGEHYKLSSGCFLRSWWVWNGVCNLKGLLDFSLSCFVRRWLPAANILSNPEVYHGFCVLNFTSKLSSWGLWFGVLQGPASIFCLYLSQFQSMPWKPSLPFCSAWDQRPHEPEKLFQRWTHILHQPWIVPWSLQLQWPHRSQKTSGRGEDSSSYLRILWLVWWSSSEDF